MAFEAGLFLRGVILGLSIAAPVGPIGVLCIRRSLAHGRWIGFISGLGAATADALYGCVVALGLGAVSSLITANQVPVRLVGGVFLLYLGVRTMLTPPAREAAASKGRSYLGAYVSMFLLTLSNPLTVLSFAAILAGVGTGDSPSAAASLALVGGVFVGSALWWAILSSAAGLLRRHLGSRAMRWINLASGAVILGFALYIVYGALSP
jgi:threonine/homoserine/homoserine lactone efflux protein